MNTDEFEFDFGPAPENAEEAPKRKVFQVAEVTRLIKTILEDELGSVWIEGEVSNLRRPASGHLYFTLKDASAQISAVLFRGNQRGLTVDVQDGAKLRVQGEITVYESRGNYQIIVRVVEDAGKGSLQEQFEKLKARLAEEGLFDEDRKQSLPTLPRHIGIVTSETGAAIRDMLHVLTRRFPHLHILVAPVAVQGEAAAPQIAEAIDTLNRRDDIEVILVGRGGGSLEDLWAFNEEQVARAIARSHIPIVSAVGHETDFTISDFVADVRAPTPSAAAEIVVGELTHFEEMIDGSRRRMVRALRHATDILRQRLVACQRSYVFQEPARLITQHRRRIGELDKDLRQALLHLARQRQQRIDEAGIRLLHLVSTSTQRRAQRLEKIESQLRALSPLAVLQRGYSLTRLADGTIVQRTDQVRDGDTVVTRLAEGEIASTVTEINKGDSHVRGKKE